MSVEGGFVECCEPMADALRFGLLIVANGEVALPARGLLEVNPDARARNVLTGESYDPGEFSMTMALGLCPWCGARLAWPIEHSGRQP